MRGTGTVTDLAVASYLAKYSTKGTETAGHASARITPDTIDLYAHADGTDPERLIHACWKLGAHPGYASLRRWAHMLGFGGHFLTKARRYSIRFADLRQARISYRRGQDAGPEHGPIRAADHADEDTTLVIGTLTFAGTDWRTTGDALLANTAADQARKRREAGRDELADEYSRTAAYGEAA
jgi:Replication initiator protein, pSAM2